MTENRTGLTPFNVEAEEALLGSILINPSILPTIELKANDFYIERHQWIWLAMTQIQNNGGGLDFISVTERLRQQGKLDEAGGQGKIVALVNRTPSSLNAEHYAGIVKEKSRRRHLLQAAQELASAALNDSSDLDDITTSATNRITETIQVRHEMQHIGEAIPDLIDSVVESSKNPNSAFGIPTGFIDLDNLTGGLTGLWYIAGPPGIGKSILMLQAVVHAAKKGNAGAIFSLEMKTLAQLMRAVSAEARIPTKVLKTGKIKADEWEAFYKACDDIAKLPIYICDEPDLTTAQLNAQVARLKSKVDLKLVALDYLYLMGDDDSLESTERTELLSKRIKATQRRYDIPFLTVNSVTKAGMEGTPTMTDLRGSGQLIHDADVVLFISKHGMIKSMRTVSIVKGRDLDSLGKFDLIKTDHYPSFRNVEEKEKVTSAFSGRPVEEPIP